jgi:hypothetical protein
LAVDGPIPLLSAGNQPGTLTCHFSAAGIQEQKFLAISNALESSTLPGLTLRSGKGQRLGKIG